MKKNLCFTVNCLDAVASLYVVVENKVCLFIRFVCVDLSYRCNGFEIKYALTGTFADVCLSFLSVKY